MTKRGSAGRAERAKRLPRRGQPSRGARATKARLTRSDDLVGPRVLRRPRSARVDQDSGCHRERAQQGLAVARVGLPGRGWWTGMVSLGKVRSRARMRCAAWATGSAACCAAGAACCRAAGPRLTVQPSTGRPCCDTSRPNATSECAARSGAMLRPATARAWGSPSARAPKSANDSRGSPVDSSSCSRCAFNRSMTAAAASTQSRGAPVAARRVASTASTTGSSPACCEGGKGQTEAGRYGARQGRGKAGPARSLIECWERLVTSGLQAVVRLVWSTACAHSRRCGCGRHRCKAAAPHGGAAERRSHQSPGAVIEGVVAVGGAAAWSAWQPCHVAWQVAMRAP